jgi:hypothetical protein
MAHRLIKKLKTPVVLIAMGVVLALVLIVFFIGTPITRRAVTVLGGNKLPTADAERLSKALNSGGKQEQGMALASELRGAYASQAKPLIRSGQHVTIEDNTFKVGGKFGAVVEADVTGQGKLELLLVKEQGQWLIYDTEPVK